MTSTETATIEPATFEMLSSKCEIVQVRLQPVDLSAVDAWIATQPEPRPSRPEAVRRLLHGALKPQK